ncbi:hypothetical protein [Stenotrophomonas rhizophila]
MDDIERLCNLAGPPQNGRRSLIGRKYFNENFERLLFGPGDPFSGGVEIRDCEFIACSTDSTFSISQGVHMQSVLFDGVRSPDAMMVSSASVLENIVVRGGKKVARLWCKPPSEGDVSEAVLQWSKAGMAHVELAIDLSELAAEDSLILGIPLSKLRWNPEIHVPVLASWRDSPSWDDLDLARNSLWRIFVTKVRNSGCAEGLFTATFPHQKSHIQFTEEMARIESAGLLVR